MGIRVAWVREHHSQVYSPLEIQSDDIGILIGFFGAVRLFAVVLESGRIIVMSAVKIIFT